MSEHDWDMCTDYCRKCGAAREMIVLDYQSCNDGENVTGISHIIAHRRLGSMLMPVWQAMIDQALK